jgi:hypothetical protein
MNIISMVLLLIGLFLAIKGFRRGLTLKSIVMRGIPPEDDVTKRKIEEMFLRMKIDPSWGGFGGGFPGFYQKKGEFMGNWLLFLIGIIFIITGVILAIFQLFKA